MKPPKEEQFDHDSLEFLRTFGRDLSFDAAKSRTPICGRDREIAQTVAVLCRETKRNPVLIGDPGVGKSAIVEGLAQRILSGDVPKPLRKKSVFEVRVANLTAGCNWFGMLENRVKALLAEARRNDVIVFIDEFHTLMDSGPGDGPRGIAEMLKQDMARGSIRLIGATTGEEYRRYVETDPAFERRVSPIWIGEMDRGSVRAILASRVSSRSNGVVVRPETLDAIVRFAPTYLNYRRSPDREIEVFEQLLANASNFRKREIDNKDLFDVLNSICGFSEAAQERLETFKNWLVAERFTDQETSGKIFLHLAGAINALTPGRERPRTVFLARSRSNELAVELANALFEDDTRLVRVNLSAMQSAQDLSQLVGSAPGFAGFNQPTAIQKLRGMPNSVVHIEGIDRCDSVIRDFVIDALESGNLFDACGRQISLKSTFVVISEHSAGARNPIGFVAKEETGARSGIDRRLDAIVDFELFPPAKVAPDQRRGWVRRIVRDMSDRFRDRLIFIEVCEEAQAYLKNAARMARSYRECEKLVVSELLALLMPYLGTVSSPMIVSVISDRLSLSLDDQGNAISWARRNGSRRTKC